MFREGALQDLFELGESMAGSMFVQDVFRVISDRVSKELNCSALRLWLLDRDRKDLVLRGTSGRANASPTRAHVLRQQSFSSKGISVGRSESDVAATISLKRGSQAIGVLELHFDRNRILSPNLTQLLGEIQSLVSTAVVRSMVYEHSIFAAVTDPLTDLPNENAFDSVLADKLVWAIRDGHPLSVLVLDLDNVDQMSKGLPQAGAESVVNRVARITTQNLREMDLVARSHDGEFLAILPNASEHETLAVMKRIAESFYGELESLLTDETERPRLNFGWAVLGIDGDSPPLLLRMARFRRDRSKDPRSSNNILVFRSPASFLQRYPTDFV